MVVTSLTSLDLNAVNNIVPSQRQSDIDATGTTTTDAAAVLLNVDGRFTSRHGFSVRNIHASNVAQWQVWGSLSDSATAPVQADASWVSLKALGDIAANNGTDSFSIVDSIWAWFKIEIKAKVGGSQGTVQIWHRGRL